VLFRGRLDAQLAAGLDPQSDPALALRARQLIRARSRRRLARSVEHLVEEVDADRNWWLSAAVPFLRDQVVAARGTLTALAGALRDAEPISPRGVAITSRLITDPASPLYVPRWSDHEVPELRQSGRSPRSRRAAGVEHGFYSAR
jgi:hypothetical protein